MGREGGKEGTRTQDQGQLGLRIKAWRWADRRTVVASGSPGLLRGKNQFGLVNLHPQRASARQGFQTGLSDLGGGLNGALTPPSGWLESRKK